MAYKINLKHRGSDVIEWIDLFDEASYGADKLFFRGKFLSKEEIKSQVLAAIGIGQFYDMETAKEPEDLEAFKLSLGVGNPIAKPTSDNLSGIPTIALNRWHIPNKKFWNNTPPQGVENPYRASAAVKFTIRIHFYNDFAYINFGIPWEIVDEAGDNADEIFATEDDFISNLRLLQCHFISAEDAKTVLKDIFGDDFDTSTESADLLSNDSTILTMADGTAF